MGLRLAFGTILLAVSSQALDAQIFPQIGPSDGPWTRWNFDIAAQNARPVGAFAANVDEAWGIQLGGRYRFRGSEFLGLAANFGYLTYGRENKRVPLSQTVNRVMVDMTTTNNIVLVTAGPMLAVPRGPVRPYAYGFGGFSYFYTQTSVGDDSDGDGGFASSEHLGDFGLAYGYGGGFMIPFTIRRARVALDLGARQTWNGTRTYLRRGDIQDQPDGSLLLNPRTTDATFWQFHAGLSFTIPRRVTVQR